MKIIKTIFYHIDGTKSAEDTGLGSSETNYVKAEVYYSEGGYSYFTYKNTPRAYFMSVNKIGRGKDAAGTWESYGLLSGEGANLLIEEVSRQSKKREENALAYFDEHVDEFVAKVYPDLKVTREEERYATV